MALAGKGLERGIRVNDVGPGPVDTPIFPDFTQDVGEDAMQSMVDMVGRPGKPTDIAEALVTLAEGQISWLNGQHIIVDGGQIACMNNERFMQIPGLGTEEQERCAGVLARVGSRGDESFGQIAGLSVQVAVESADLGIRMIAPQPWWDHAALAQVWTRAQPVVNLDGETFLLAGAPRGRVKG